MTVRIKLATNFHGLLFFAMAVTMGVIETRMVSSAFFAHNPDMLAFAITFDIALGIPILYYVLAVRQKHARPVTLIPIFILSLGLAGLILPVAQHAYLDRLKLVIPFLEFFVLSYLAVKIRAILKIFRAIQAHELYFSDALRASCKRVLGELPGLDFILTEFSLLYCAGVGWFKQYEQSSVAHTPFFYHRKSGYGAILGVIFMVIITETLALHLLLQQWSRLAAWVFTGLSAYSLLWMLGDYHALRLHPIVLSEKVLFIRIGLRWRINLALSDISMIEKFRAREKRGKEYLSLAIFGDPRLIIHCKQPVLVQGLFGIKRVVSQIGLAVDDEKLFMERLQLYRNVGEK